MAPTVETERRFKMSTEDGEKQGEKERQKREKRDFIEMVKKRWSDGPESNYRRSFSLMWAR